MRLPLAGAILLAAALIGCEKPARPTVSLYRAVSSSDLDQVRRHLYWETDINRPDSDGDHPLHVAARLGTLNIARELLKHGAEPAALNRSEQTPIEVALANGRTQVARMLVQNGVPLDRQAMLAKLVRDGLSDRDVFEFLIVQGADVNQPDARGETLLTSAIARGHLQAVTRLIGYGANVNQPDAGGRLPLDLALTADKGADRVAIVELLKRHGARASNNSGTDTGANQTLKTQGKPE